MTTGTNKSRYRWEIVHDLIKDNLCEVIAEVGVYYGETARYVLQNYGSKLTRYYLIEMILRDSIKELVRDYPFIDIINMESKHASAEIADDSLDFIFIDANHSYNSVLEDITLWTPKVKEGGIISGHDYCDSHPGVMMAVSRKFKKINLEFDTEHAEKTNAVWWTRREK
jgi:predicted O-methyltransferase YrrM